MPPSSLRVRTLTVLHWRVSVVGGAHHCNHGNELCVCQVIKLVGVVP